MRAFFKGAILAVSSTLILACGGGGGAFDKAADHADKMVSLIESNKTDANKAADAVEKYIADNKVALEPIKADIQKMMGEMMGEMMAAGDDKDKAAAIEKKYQPQLEGFEKRTKALEERMNKLQAENPALKDNPRIEAAMESLFGGIPH